MKIYSTWHSLENKAYTINIQQVYEVLKNLRLDKKEIWSSS